jgi:hypothetical protein
MFSSNSGSWDSSRFPQHFISSMPTGYHCGLFATIQSLSFCSRHTPVDPHRVSPLPALRWQKRHRYVERVLQPRIPPHIAVVGHDTATTAIPLVNVASDGISQRGVFLQNINSEKGQKLHMSPVLRISQPRQGGIRSTASLTRGGLGLPLRPVHTVSVDGMPMSRGDARLFVARSSSLARRTSGSTHSAAQCGMVLFIESGVDEAIVTMPFHAFTRGDRPLHPRAWSMGMNSSSQIKFAAR